MSTIDNKHFVAVFFVGFLVIASFPATAEKSAWQAVTGASALRTFMSGLTMHREIVGGGVTRAEYYADGTGKLSVGGASFARNWEIRGESQICISTGDDFACFEIEKNTNEAGRYRGVNVATQKFVEFNITDENAVVEASPKDVSSGGGAATPSAEEIAAELANPNTVLGTLNTNFDYITYDGDLPGANEQSAFKVSLQPSLPYPLGGGTNFFVRPNIPIIIDQPVYTANNDFDSVGVELGDITLEASLGFTVKHTAGSSIMTAGMMGTLPTATHDALGKDQWLLGPQLGFFSVRKWGVIGIVASHQWDVAGEDSFDTSITSGQYVYNLKLTRGWQLFSGPVWSYNHKADSGNKWTLPAGIGLSKTAILKGRAWKFSVQYWNYVKSPDDFGPEHLLRFTAGPVVKLPWKEGNLN